MAKRDLTAEQFRAALERNGFEEYGWGRYRDKTGRAPGFSWGGLTGRRETITYLIRARKAAAAQFKATA